MTKYKADLGSWEKGRTVQFEAESNSDALRKAESLINDDVDGQDAEVVQIKVYKDNWYTVYDYFNGFFDKH